MNKHLINEGFYPRSKKSRYACFERPGFRFLKSANLCRYKGIVPESSKSAFHPYGIVKVLISSHLYLIQSV